MSPATDWIPVSVAMPTSNDLVKVGDWYWILGFHENGDYDADGFWSLDHIHSAIREREWTHWARIKPPPSADQLPKE